MARTRKTYTPEFMLRAVKMVFEQKLAVAEVATRTPADVARYGRVPPCDYYLPGHPNDLGSRVRRASPCTSFC